MTLPNTSKTIGLAILSWKSPLTVKASVQTYVEHDLFSLFDDAVICFQEMDETDAAMAESMGVRYVGNKANTGIQGGFRFAHDSLKTDYMIVLENDLPMTVSLECAKKQLIDCIAMLEEGKIDMARIRNLFNPGFPIRAASTYSKYFTVKSPHPLWAGTETLDESPAWKKWIRRTLRPGKARKWSGRSVYIEHYPEKLFPDIIHREGEYLVVDSSAMPWTNQPTLVSREMLGNLLDYADAHPSSRTVNGFQDFEKSLNCSYWRNRHFKIAIMPGIFTHERLDR